MTLEKSPSITYMKLVIV